LTIKIVFLGTGAAIPMKRGLPCIALRIDSDIYLFDIGEGCQKRLFAMGLSPVKIKGIFITHLHGDHYLGLFGLFQTMHLMGRKEPLVIIAPHKLKELLEAYENIGLLNIDFPIEYIDTKPCELYRDGKIIISSFKVEHGIEAYGYKAQLKNGIAIVYTGDTRPCRSVVEESEKADILIHESTFTSDMREEAYKEGHSTAADAGKHAYEANVKELVLFHISARYRNTDLLFYDAYRYFRNVNIAEDYMTLYV